GGGGDRRARRQGVAEHGAVRAARAAGEVDSRQASQERAPVGGLRGGGRRPRAGEEATGVGERGGDLVRAEQAEVANLHEARGQDVEQEAAEKLARGDGHAAAVLGREADSVGGDGLEAVVGEADAVGVAAEVVEDLGGPPKGRLAWTTHSWW